MTTLNELKMNLENKLENLQDASHSMVSGVDEAIAELESMIDDLEVDIEDIEGGEAGDLDAKKSELQIMTKEMGELEEKLEKCKYVYDLAFNV